MPSILFESPRRPIAEFAENEEQSSPIEGLMQYLRPGADQIPPGVLLALQASEWMRQVDFFRHAELKRIQGGTYERKRTEHRISLEGLIAQGDSVLEVWKRTQGVPSLSFTHDDMEATLNGLRDTLRAEHGPKLHPSRANTILSSFDELQPAN